MRTSRTIRTLTAGTVAALGLTACAADQTGASAPSASPTTTATGDGTSHGPSGSPSTGPPSTGSSSATGSPDVGPTTETPLPGDDPTTEVPFPANRRPDVRPPSQGATLSPVDLRFGRHRSFDRVVLDVRGDGLPGWRAEYVDRPRLSGSGAPISLAGDAALRVRVRGVVLPTREGARDYRGPQRFRPDGAGGVEEVVYGSIYEGQVDLFLGTAAERPFRVFLLQDPKRVVIDVVRR